MMNTQISHLLKDKLKAFSIHLIFSISVSVLCLCMVLVWYPSNLIKATGTTMAFLLMLGIDIICGPLLTAIVYKKGKKSLKIDLLVIVLIQVAALCYGMYHIFLNRPAWIVFDTDTFYVIRANEVNIASQEKATPEFAKNSLVHPQWVDVTISQKSSNSYQTGENILDQFAYNIIPAQKPELYQPITVANHKIMETLQGLDILKKYNDIDDVNTILAKYPKAKGFIPLSANKIDMTVLVNSEGKVIDIVNLRPW